MKTIGNPFATFSGHNLLPVVLTSVTFAASAGATDYTWLAAPANAIWDTSSANWSGGSGTWVDDASAPNNATFGSSSKTTLTVPAGETRLVGNLTVNLPSLRFNTGTISVAGAITANQNVYFEGPLASGRGDGSLHIAGAGQVCLYNDGNKQGLTVLEGSGYIVPLKDGAFGPVPASPAENILVTGTPLLKTVVSGFNLDANRTMKIASGQSFKFNGSYQSYFHNLVVAEPSPGLDYSTNTFFRATGYNNAVGRLVFDPGAGRTNAFGRLQITDAGRATVMSGAMLVTAPLQANGYGTAGDSAALLVQGNGTSFDTTKGDLLVEGSTLLAPQTHVYADVSQYGQVRVQNGGRIDMAGGEWLNGNGTPGRLTVGNGGEVSAEKCYVTMSDAASEIHLNAGGVMKVRYFDIHNGKVGDFHFNGGTVMPLNAAGVHFVDKQWDNVRFLVDAGGAVFAPGAGRNVWWQRPLVSGSESDGGIAKTGEGRLVLHTANSYNGPTSVAGGTVQVQADGGLPPGTALALSGGATIDFSSDDDPGQARDTTNWLARVEGAGTLANASGLHVTNAVAPSVGGTIAFGNPCDLRGDYAISIGAGGCGCIEVAAGQNISGLRLSLPDASVLDRGTRYQILSAPDGFTGKFDESALPAGWGVRYGTTSAILVWAQPTTLYIR